jgi:hypothetical protein
LAPQVTLDRGKDDTIVVYGENGWLGQDRFLLSPMMPERRHRTLDLIQGHY